VELCFAGRVCRNSVDVDLGTPKVECGDSPGAEAATLMVYASLIPQVNRQLAELNEQLTAAMETGVAEIMSPGFFIIAVISALGLAGLLFWGLRGASHRQTTEPALAAFENAPRHLRNMAQIRQAMDIIDLQYAAQKGGQRLADRLRRERRQVTLLYLAAIRRDFEQSLRVARIVAVLSPEVSGSHEYERLRLSVLFRMRVYVIKISLAYGYCCTTTNPYTGTDGDITGDANGRGDGRLGERAALAGGLALQSDGNNPRVRVCAAEKDADLILRNSAGHGNHRFTV